MTNTIYLFLFLLSLTLSSCGGGEHSATDTGSASFGLKFEEASVPAMKLAPSMAPATDICTSYEIDSISGTVYNSSNTVIATGGPWACSAHTGTIYNIPTGSNIRITIKGTVSGTVVWQGETTGATIYAGQDTNVGSIPMTYTGSDTTRPTITVATPTGDTVPLTSPITVTFSEYMASSTIDATTFTLKNGSVAVSGSVSYNSTTKTATFTPTSSLSNSVIYTATVTTDVTDMAANRMQSLYTWDFTTEAPPGSAPTAPTGVSAIAADKQVMVSWTAVSGATSYNIYWSTTTGVTKTNGTPITGATSPYTHTALTNGTTYYYVVTAVNNYGESAASSQVSAIPLPPITSAPTGISATAGNGQATISWSAVSGATSYNLYWSTTTGVTTSNGTKITGATSPYTHTGLTNGTTYYYIITAVNIGGESTASSQTSATPQVPVSGAPTGVSATAGNSQVTISWSTVTGATSYKVYWSTTSGSGTGGTAIAVGNVTSYTHIGLTNGTSYYYVVTAVNAGGESAASSQASATPVPPVPSAPTGVSAAAGNTQATISWTAVTGATSYNLYWSTTTGVTTANGTKITGGTSPYIHTGRTNGTTYYYIVTAVNLGGESAASAQVSATPSALMGGSIQGTPLNLTSTNATVTTFVGSAGLSGSTDGTGTAARFNGPNGVTTDGTNLYVADQYNQQIRKIVVSTGVVTILAGSGTAGSTDATGTAASFNGPNGVTTDGANLYVADYYNHKIRKIVISTGAVTTLAGSATVGSIDATGTAASFNYPVGVTTDGTNLFVADQHNHKIRKIVISSGAVTTLAGSGTAGATDATGTTASFNYPAGITTDGTNLYVADPYNHKIRKIVISTGVVTTLAGSGTIGSTDAITTAASFNYPTGITTDGTSLYVADQYNHKIRKIVISTGVVTTLAGSGTAGSSDATGTAASFNYPIGITTDGANLFVADWSNHTIRKIQPTVLIGGAVQGAPLNLTNTVTTFAGSAGLAGSTDGTGTAARFIYTDAITTDGTNLFVADTFNHTIRKIAISTGAVTTIAGSAGIVGSTDGTGTAARFNNPTGITTDGTNLFVTDSYNHTIRKIVISTGVVTTIAGSAGLTGSTDAIGTAARFNNPAGITTDGTNLFVTDYLNYTIRKIVMSTGVVTTFAGSAGLTGSTDGTGIAARFNNPIGITTDGTNLFVTDYSNHTIRKIVISTGAVTTIAGSAGGVGSTDGTGTAARFNQPVGITTDGTNLFVADYSNHTIRKIVIFTGAVTTIAGSAGVVGSTDGTGAAARFNSPYGITTDGTDLFVADCYNYTIRKIQ